MDSKSQNMDDILRLLEQSIQSDEAFDTTDMSHTKRLSDDQVQQELRKRYFTSTETSEAQDDGEYRLDADFLREVNAAVETEKNSSSQKRKKKEKAPIPVAEEPQIPEDAAATEDVFLPEAHQEMVQEEENEIDDRAPWESDEESIESEEPLKMIDAPDIEDAIEDEISFVAEEIQETVEERAEDFEEYQAEPDLLQILEEALQEKAPCNFETTENMDDTVVGEDDTSEVFEIEEPLMQALSLSELLHNDSVEESENENSLEEEKTEETTEQTMEPAMMDLLLQLGCRDELEETVAPKQLSDYYAQKNCDIPTDPALSYVDSQEEYVSHAQDEDLERQYQKKIIRSILQMTSCAILTFVVFLYDLLPLLQQNSFGFFDYRSHPVAYVLFGLQLVLVCCLPVIGKVWQGLKKLIRLQIDAYAIAVAAILTVAMHDASLLGSSAMDFPVVFHFYAVLTLLAAVCADHLLLCRERCAFRVYRMENTAYTLLVNEGAHSVAEKMYRGGLNAKQQVRSPAMVSFPNRFFRSVCEKEKKSSIFQWLFVPIVLLAMACGVLCMHAGQDMFASVTTIFIALLCSLPVFIMLVDSLLLYLSARRLMKRQSAIAGKGSIARYAATNIMVFHDLHAFARCRSEDVGIVFYEKDKAMATLGALHALYADLGGPMSSLFEEVPDAYRCSEVKIIRLFRNGVEAILDQSKLLIVGDREFMTRYGFSYPEEEKVSANKRLTLCVSLNGGLTAKINVQYELEPIFEVLTERLAEERIFCAVETCDPLISSTLVANLRERGHTPINIVHKTAYEHRCDRSDGLDVRREPTGILTHQSRLKLAEIVIFCRRLFRIRKNLIWQATVVSLISFFGACALLLLHQREWLWQYALLAFQLIVNSVMLLIGCRSLPKKHHISVAAWDKEAKKKNKNKKHKKDDIHE